MSGPPFTGPPNCPGLESAGGGGAGALLGITLFTVGNLYTVGTFPNTILDAVNLVLTFETAAEGPGSTEVIATAQIGAEATSAAYLGWSGAGAPAESCQIIKAMGPLLCTCELLVTGLAPATTYTWKLCGGVDAGVANYHVGINGIGVGNTETFPALLAAYAGLN